MDTIMDILKTQGFWWVIVVFTTFSIVTLAHQYFEWRNDDGTEKPLSDDWRWPR